MISSHRDSGGLPGDIDVGVMRSTNDGATWNAGQLLDTRPSTYSCKTVLRDGRIGILY